MTTFFCLPCENFIGQEMQFTIATVLVVLNKEKNKILMTTGKSTERWQYIGGRYSDDMSFRDNARHHAKEAIGHDNIKITNKQDPILLLDMIDLKGYDEKTLLIHYIAEMNDDTNIGNAEWKDLEEIRMIHAKNQASSDNVSIIAEKLLNPKK